MDRNNIKAFFIVIINPVLICSLTFIFQVPSPAVLKSLARAERHAKMYVSYNGNNKPALR